MLQISQNGRRVDTGDEHLGVEHGEVRNVLGTEFGGRRQCSGERDSRSSTGS
jgi:hypothetical protein